MGRHIFIGDVQGCGSVARALIEKIVQETKQPLTSDDHIIFCGDLLNRGNEPELVWKLIEELRTQCQVHGIYGNHDAKHVANGSAHNVPEDEACTFMSWAQMTGGSYDKMIQFLKDSSSMIVTDKFVAVHNALDPYVSLEDQDPQLLAGNDDAMEELKEKIRAREGKDIPWYELCCAKGISVVFGHENAQYTRGAHDKFDMFHVHYNSRTRSQAISLDRGVDYGASLCAIVCDDTGRVTFHKAKPPKDKNPEQKVRVGHFVDSQSHRDATCALSTKELKKLEADRGPEVIEKLRRRGREIKDEVLVPVPDKNGHVELSDRSVVVPHLLPASKLSKEDRAKGIHFEDGLLIPSGKRLKEFPVPKTKIFHLPGPNSTQTPPLMKRSRTCSPEITA